MHLSRVNKNKPLNHMVDNNSESLNQPKRMTTWLTTRTNVPHLPVLYLFYSAIKLHVKQFFSSFLIACCWLGLFFTLTYQDQVNLRGRQQTNRLECNGRRSQIARMSLRNQTVMFVRYIWLSGSSKTINDSYRQSNTNRTFLSTVCCICIFIAWPTCGGKGGGARSMLSLYRLW